MAEEIVAIKSPKELMEWLDVYDILLNLSEQESQVLLNYMEGHAYQIGVCQEKMYRMDLTEEPPAVEEMAIDDLIDSAVAWNYEMIEQAEAEKQNPKNFVDYCNNYERCISLREDEEVLDGMYARTIYGKEFGTVAMVQEQPSEYEVKKVR